MSFAQIKRLSQRLSVRLAFYFSLLFVISAGVSFGILYFYLSEHLKKNDQSIIEAKWREYSEVYRSSGIDGLKSALSADRTREGDIPLLVQVLDSGGASLFLKVPEDSQAEHSEIEKRLRKNDTNDGWSDIRSPHENDRIDFFITHPEGQSVLLRVGKSSDPRDDLLESVAQVFSLICAIAVAVGAALGMFFSNRTLAPLRNLVSTMKEVRQGSLSSRVPVTPTGDEMEELTSIFNQMLDRVEHLVVGMRETLDNIAHDIRTPVTRMRAVAELRLKAPASPDDRTALEVCAESAEDVSSILTSLLDLAEAETGTMRLRKELVNISSLVRPVIELYEMVAEDKAIMISFEAFIDPLVNVDPPRIRQVLGNLLDNAIKYSPPGSEVLFQAEQSDDSVTITIKDRGQGIHVEDLPRIWDRLFRADRSRSQQGLGIGLSIVRSIVQVHGGTVHVESEPGTGSRFSIRLPK